MLTQHQLVVMYGFILHNLIIKNIRVVQRIFIETKPKEQKE